MSKPIVTMEAWQMFFVGGKPAQLRGFVTGHPKLPGLRRHIRSSRVLRFDAETGETETLNTVYRLRAEVRDVVAEDGEPVRFAIGDLIAHRNPGTETWDILRGTTRLATGLPSTRVAILSMLAILDRAPPSDDG